MTSKGVNILFLFITSTSFSKIQFTVKILKNAQALIRIITFYGNVGGHLLEAV